MNKEILKSLEESKIKSYDELIKWAKSIKTDAEVLIESLEKLKGGDENATESNNSGNAR